MPLKSFLNVVTRPRVKFSGRFTEQNIGIRFHLTHPLSIVLVGNEYASSVPTPRPPAECSTELSHVPILIDLKIRGKSNELQRKVMSTWIDRSETSSRLVSLS